MKRSRGFTLIEMLIVIAVIGVLAVAVLSAINPVEQMRKARDTRRRSNAAELLNALERYYATNEEYDATFLLGTVDGTGCASIVVAGGVVDTADLAELIASNELKEEFSARIDSAENTLYAGIDSTAGTDLASVCYEIESAANKAKYAAAANWCVDAVSGSEYVCLPE